MTAPSPLNMPQTKPKRTWSPPLSEALKVGFETPSANLRPSLDNSRRRRLMRNGYHDAGT